MFLIDPDAVVFDPEAHGITTILTSNPYLGYDPIIHELYRVAKQVDKYMNQDVKGAGGCAKGDIHGYQRPSLLGLRRQPVQGLFHCHVQLYGVDPYFLPAQPAVGKKVLYQDIHMPG